MDSARRLREEFSKICFETLLKYSFINEPSSSNDNIVITRLALGSMLTRCKEILQKYAHDERLHGKCPLPRYKKSSLFLRDKIGYFVFFLEKFFFKKKQNMRIIE
jgi:hypothetical protein